MSVFVLKIIALTAMVIDHAGYFLAGHQLVGTDMYNLMRSIGRIAFPVYCFLLVNGFEKTSDRPRYLSRLMLFALLSQIPFTLTFSLINYGSPSGGFEFSFGFFPLLYAAFSLCAAAVYFFLVKRDISALWAALFLLLGAVRLKLGGYQILGESLNVFYTLSLGLAAIAVIDKLLYQDGSLPEAILQALMLLVAIMLLQPNADYAYGGLALILALYLFRQWRPAQLAVIFIWCLCFYWGWARINLYFSFFSLLPVLFYNGKKGPGMKLAFYAVYPLHLLVLGILNFVL